MRTLQKEGIKFLEHTGDTGLCVRANTVEMLFCYAATGMFKIICPECAITSLLTRKINLQAENLQELFVNWLAELNFLFCTKQELYGKFEVEKINTHHIHARVYGERVNLKKHHIHTEIKAVTYHMLNICQDKSGGEAQVIFDI